MSTIHTPLLPLPDDDNVLLTRTQLPMYLPIAAQTLARLASEGEGPRITRIGKRRVAYRAGDVRAWLARGDEI
jgi:predicted DNA-binding transcriptional regulator AlpA